LTASKRQMAALVKEVLSGLIAPVKDIFMVEVHGGILGLPKTNIVAKVSYFTLALFGLIVFINGIIATGIDASTLVTTSEIVPMEPTVQYPVIWGCLDTNIDTNAGNIGHKTYWEGATGKGKATISGDTTTSYSEVKFYSDLGSTADDTSAKTLLENVVKVLGTGYSKTSCFVANLDKKFKPKYDKKMKLELGFTQTQAVLGTSMYSVMGFVEHGKTDATEAGFTYAAFQNTLHTIGIGIDKEIDNKGASWTPKAEKSGKAKEVYSINTAVTPNVYAADGSLKADAGTAGSLETYYVFYMDTFIKRKTVIRNKSAKEIFDGLGAALASAMLFMSGLFKDDTVDGKKVKTFRFQDLKSAAKAAAKKADDATGASAAAKAAAKSQVAPEA